MDIKKLHKIAIEQCILRKKQPSGINGEYIYKQDYNILIGTWWNAASCYCSFKPIDLTKQYIFSKFPAKGDYRVDIEIRYKGFIIACYVDNIIE